ncbi:hypothetical protein RHSIM_Rhsim13G0180500 [Rhododendron simsii]|uniref:glutamate--tRNA ligase n=1 Tax=Rhododendron simsii TaxID=118357 RepID=A0A834L6Y2_RHOSS|nr:hypothetical protein RHSIM_Rhsim13G0180500 [Rhododendron simsii]
MAAVEVSPCPARHELESQKFLQNLAVGTASILKIPLRKALDACQTDDFCRYALEEAACCSLADAYLLKHTYLAGDFISAVDIAIWVGLAGSGQRWESLRKSKKFPNLSIAAKVKGKERANRHVGGNGKGVLDLKNAVVGKVRLRFAPEPSGYLRIGHSKAALLNQHFAQEFKGKVIVRFDDTNPAKESNDFVVNILKDIDTLGIEYDEVTYTSDYFPKLMKMAEELIIQGKAYVDDTQREQMQKERMDGTESRCRNNSTEENMKLWKEMSAGSERGLQCCLRGKLDMQDPNKSLRDPEYYRCNPIPHHRVGSSYKIYPTYDFACPIVDALTGVTHALRSSEYHDRNAQYHRIQEDMGLGNVEIYEFSRLNFVYTLLSKRKLAWFVDHGMVEGWDDPRFPTVKGIVRRGLTIEALIKFVVYQGGSKNLNLMEWDKLLTINKKQIDCYCPRHTAVIEEGRVMLTLTDGPEKPFVRIIPRHKTFEVKEIMKDGNDCIVQLTGVLHLEGSVKTTRLKLTWLPEMSELVNLSLVEFDYLITNKMVDEGEDFLDVLNKNTRKETAALGDSNMRNLQRGDALQLERKCYFRCDVPFVGPCNPIVLFAIPDGRQQKRALM